MNVLFLYTEIADYFLKCCETLSKSAAVHIIRWPLNQEAPFDFNYPEGIKVYEKEEYSREKLKELTASIHPDIIICSGWLDKDYLAVTKDYFKKIPTVLTCDTHWRASAKQYLAMALSRFFLLNTFSHGWVPGKIQRTYLNKLGFRDSNIHEGFYSCDLNKFNALYVRNKKIKEKAIPKRFLYVGRYFDFKGLADLWQAFVELQKEQSNDWELWCLGAGDLEPIQHPKIKHFGFVQPKDLDPILEECGVFVLPSRFEPWGVVVQEYAAAGFPLLLSSAVGAKEVFLDDNKNGFLFSPSSLEEIKNALKKVINLSGKALILMAERSHELAQANSPEKWANTVIKIYNESKK